MAMSLVRGQLGNPPPPDPNEPSAMAAAEPDAAAGVAEGLAKYIREAYECARDFRNQSGVDDTLLTALRAVRGEYSAQKLTEIKQMGGADVYLRISANKVRAVAASLRDVFISADRPWTIDPTSVPETPFDQDKEQLINTVIETEVKEALMNGGGSAVTPQLIFERRRALRETLYQHTMEQARTALR